MPKPSNPDSIYTALGLYGAAGFQLALSVVLGLALGHWLDGKFATAPVFLLMGIVLGSAAGFINLFRLVLWYADRKERGGNESNSSGS